MEIKRLRLECEAIQRLSNEHKTRYDEKKKEILDSILWRIENGRVGWIGVFCNHLTYGGDDEEFIDKALQLYHEAPDIPVFAGGSYTKRLFIQRILKSLGSEEFLEYHCKRVSDQSPDFLKEGISRYGCLPLEIPVSVTMQNCVDFYKSIPSIGFTMDVFEKIQSRALRGNILTYTQEQRGIAEICKTIVEMKNYKNSRIERVGTEDFDFSDYDPETQKVLKKYEYMDIYSLWGEYCELMKLKVEMVIANKYDENSLLYYSNCPLDLVKVLVKAGFYHLEEF